MEPFIISDIHAAIAKVRQYGEQPDTIVMSPRVHHRIFVQTVPIFGNSHQRRIAKRTNTRREKFRKSIIPRESKLMKGYEMDLTTYPHP